MTPTSNPLQKRRSNVPGLVCAFMASVTTGGTIYAFGIYGDDLKKSLGLSQIQLDGISATFFIAGLFSWAPGMVVDRQGMRFSMMLGGCSGALSTLLYWGVARKFLPVNEACLVPLLAILAIMMSLSCGLIIGSIFKLTLLCGGPRDKGSAVGIAKGFVGLGAGVYATIFQALRTPGESALDFLPVIAFFFVTNAFMPALLLLPNKNQACPSLIEMETTPLHFRTLFLSLLLLGCLIVGNSVSDIVYGSQYSDEPNYRKVATLVVLWWGPILSLLIMPRQKHSGISTITSAVSFAALHVQDEAEVEQRDVEAEETTLLLDSNVSDSSSGNTNSYQSTTSQSGHYMVTATATSKEHGDHSIAVKAPSDSCNEHPESADCSLPEMLQTPSAWLMLWTCAILVGSGTCKTNNMGEMVEALGFDEAINPATLAIFSVSQMAARIITGIVSEQALQWDLSSLSDATNRCFSTRTNSSRSATGRNRGIPRPFFLVVASTICFVAHLMLATSTSQTAFVLGCTVAGIAFGMAWPLMVLIVGDIFGLEHHGANYLFYDGFTKAVGTVALSTLVAGTVYENHATSLSTTIGDDGGASVCLGPECFRNTHLIVAGLALTGIAASVVLQHWTKSTYRTNQLSK